MQQAEGVETEVSWPQEEHVLHRVARLNAKFQEFEDELDRKKVFENLKKVLVCATLEAEKASAAAVSLGQRYEARVRQLEELLMICQRERDEAREECLHLRERLAQARNCVGGTAEQSMAAEEKALQSQQQQQLQQQQQQVYHGSTGLQRHSVSRRRSRSLERTPSIHLELHPKTQNVNDLRQPSLQTPLSDSENRHPPPRPVHIEMQINSPDAQSSLTSSLQIDVRSSDDQQSLIIETPQNLGGQGMAASSQSLQHVHLGRLTSASMDLQRTLKLQQEQMGFQEHLHQPPERSPQQLHQQQHGHLHQQQQQESHLNLRLLEPPDPQLHGHSSYESCSNFHVPSFTSSTTPVSSDILAGLHPGGFGAESVSSSSLLQRQHSLHLPEPPEADLQVMLKSLPERGQLLRAVVQAGPLLQTLMLAGPLPQWRHPPPAVASVEIPKVAMPSGVSSMDMSKASGSFSTSYGKSG